MLINRIRRRLAGRVVRVANMGVGIVLVVAGCAAPATPSLVASLTSEVPVQPSTSAVATEPVGAFTSSRYGYSLVPPDGRTVTETPGAGGVHPDEPGVDTFTDRVGHILSVVGEPAVPALAGWTCAIGQHLQGEHKLAVEQVDDLMVAGVPARLSNYHLEITPYVIHYLTVEIARGGQGLTLSLESTTGRDDEDRAFLDAFLAQLSFAA